MAADELSKAIDHVRSIETVVPNASRLIVFMHGFRGGPKKLAPLFEAVAMADPASDIYAPCMAHSSLFSRIPAWLEALAVVAQIVARWRKKRYQGIRLVGHSMGAVIMRRVAVIALGEVHPIAEGEGAFAAPFEYDLKQQLKNAFTEYDGGPWQELPWAKS